MVFEARLDKRKFYEKLTHTYQPKYVYMLKKIKSNFKYKKNSTFMWHFENVL